LKLTILSQFCKIINFKNNNLFHKIINISIVILNKYERMINKDPPNIDFAKLNNLINTYNQNLNYISKVYLENMNPTEIVSNYKIEKVKYKNQLTNIINYIAFNGLKKHKTSTQVQHF